MTNQTTSRAGLRPEPEGVTGLVGAVVDEFPMTVTGKVRKVEMREVSTRLLGLG